MPTNDSSLEEQFGDLAQQRHADLVGMWIFLTTELMLFGGWFTGLIIGRIKRPAGFNEAASHLDILSSSVDMAVLLTSSFAVVLATKAAFAAHRRLTLGFLLTAMALGTIYIGIQAYEWYDMVNKQLMPWLGLPFHYPGQYPHAAKLFFNYYFLLTGLHGLHLLIGLGIFAVIGVLVIRWSEAGRVARQVEISGLYWIFVNVIGIFLYILLYISRT